MTLNERLNSSRYATEFVLKLHCLSNLNSLPLQSVVACLTIGKKSS